VAEPTIKPAGVVDQESVAATSANAGGANFFDVSRVHMRVRRHNVGLRGGGTIKNNYVSPLFPAGKGISFSLCDDFFTLATLIFAAAAETNLGSRGERRRRKEKK
jgi:hypothetical protein